MKLVFATLVLAACSSDTFVAPDAATDVATEAGPIDGGDEAPVCQHSTQTCPSNAVCADFDNGTTGGFVKYVVGAASADVSPDLYNSCPNGLATTLDAIDAGATDVFGGVVGSVSLNSSVDVHGTLSVQVVLPAKPTGGYLFFFSIGANHDPATGVGLVYVNGEWQLRMGNNSTSLDPLTGAWNPITLKVHFTSGGTGTNGSAELDFLDSSSQQQNKTLSLQPLAIAGVTSLDGTFGVGTLSSTGPLLVTYDDATLSLGP